MDDAMRQRIEQKLADMTVEEWDEIRNSVWNDPVLQQELRRIEASEMTRPSYYSGNALRLGLW